MSTSKMGKGIHMQMALTGWGGGWLLGNGQKSIVCGAES